jgi:hypothetical protein
MFIPSSYVPFTTGQRRRHAQSKSLLWTGCFKVLLGLKFGRNSINAWLCGESQILPLLRGIQNMARFLALINPKVKTVKSEYVVDEAPWQRLEKSAFYREVMAAARK